MSDILQIIASSRRSSAWSDPLAGISGRFMDLRVIRFVGDSPYNLFSDTSCTTPITSGSPEGWLDGLSGTGLIASNSSSGNCPVITSTSNGFCLAFDGANSQNYTFTNSGFSDNTTFVLCKPGTQTAGFTLGAMVGFTGDFEILANHPQTTNCLAVYDGGFRDASSGLGSAWHVVGITRDSSTTSFYIDGSASGTAGVSHSVGGNPSSISGNTDGFGNYYTGDIIAIISYNRVLSGGELSTVNTYLSGLIPP